MGFSTYGTLYPPFIALTISASRQGFKGVTKGLNFGTVNAVNYANIKTNIGASCLFKVEDARVVSAHGTVYYLVTEDDIIMREN